MKKCILCVLVVGFEIFLSPARLSADSDSAVSLVPRSAERTAPAKELIYESMASYGNWKLLGNAEGVKLYVAGVEYDRPFRFRLLGSRVDYAAEIMSATLWSPEKVDIEGDPMTTRHKLTPGIGITPIGFRLLWRDGRLLMPFFQTNAVVLGFNEKALSPWGAYENWSFRSSVGMKVRLRGPYDLRLDLIDDMHFSNAWVVRSNPGVDLMNVSVGLVYHLKDRHRSW